jgi:hypothetical protein
LEFDPPVLRVVEETNMANPQNPADPAPPGRLWHQELCDLLGWYEENLCHADLIDPRGHRVIFSLERFPHCIKLLKNGSLDEVSKPQKVAIAIREGRAKNADFGGFDHERAETLTWIPEIIRSPTKILEVVERTIWEKPGDTLYVKRFNKRGYPYKVLVCRKVGNQLLAPVTSHPRDHDRYSKAYAVVWEAP